MSCSWWSAPSWMSCSWSWAPESSWSRSSRWWWAPRWWSWRWSGWSAAPSSRSWAWWSGPSRLARWWSRPRARSRSRPSRCWRPPRGRARWARGRRRRGRRGGGGAGGRGRLSRRCRSGLDPADPLVAAVRDEQLARRVEGEAHGDIELGRGGRAAVAREPTRASDPRHRADRARRGDDLADHAVATVGDEEVARPVENDVERQVEFGRGGRAA